MNRSALIKHAKAVGVATIARGRGYESPKTNEGLRIDLLERLYGPNLGLIQAATPAALDKVIENGIACHKGDYGYLLSMAQHALRNANAARAEAKRIAALKRPRLAEIGAYEQSAFKWMRVCAIFGNLHSIEVGMRDNKKSEYREPV